MTGFVPMTPLRWRPLTDGERLIAKEVFGPALDAARVRLFSLPVWNRPFVPNGRLVVWPAASAPVDFADVPLWMRSILVHELTHVWQAQTGVNLPIAKLRCGDSAAAYAYDLDDGRPFEVLNIEQQAMLLQHDYLLRHGGAAPFDAQAYSRILEAWPQRAGSRPHAI